MESMTCILLFFIFLNEYLHFLFFQERQLSLWFWGKGYWICQKLQCTLSIFNFFYSFFKVKQTTIFWFIKQITLLFFSEDFVKVYFNFICQNNCETGILTQANRILNFEIRTKGLLASISLNI